MTHTLLNTVAANFSLSDQAGQIHHLTDYRGKWVVLYFYPKDMTPGCTVEACSFRDNLGRLKAAGAVVLGVSADSVKRHAKFADNEGLNFPLLSDEDKHMIKAYSAWGKKKFMGREFEGVLRNTVLIDPQGQIVKVYESVKPAGHVDQIMADLNDLQ
jgi:thioredoxin-dependent peroxiredoxin